MADLCLLVLSGVAVLEPGVEVTGAVGMAESSATPPVMGVSGLADLATGILVLKPAKLDGNGSDS